MATPRHRRLRAFSLLARTAADRGDDVAQLLKDACALLVSEMGFRRAVVYRLLPSGEIVALVGCGDPPLEQVGGLTWTLADRPLFRRALEERAAIAIEGSGEDPLLPKDVEPEKPQTLALAPLHGRDACLGFVAADAGRLSEDRVLEFGAYCDLLAAFLEQALEHERLGRLGDLKSHFIALASHELRAPVAVVHGIGVTLNARRDQLRLDDVAHLHGILNEQTAHLAHLVDQLLDLSRLDASAIRIERREVDVRRRIEELVQAVAAEHARSIEVEVEPELRTVVDPNAFDRIVSNLLANAVRYGAPPIRVEAVQRDTHFRLSVEDRGDGVASEFVPRLFERFARHEASRSGGTGLGLAIAQQYAHAHGGELLYDPATPKGARFELVLPRPHDRKA